MVESFPGMHKGQVPSIKCQCKKKKKVRGEGVIKEGFLEEVV